MDWGAMRRAGCGATKPMRSISSGANFARTSSSVSSSARIGGGYIFDFCCIDKQLIIELDGSQHLDAGEYDERRTAFLNRQGFRVVR